MPSPRRLLATALLVALPLAACSDGEASLGPTATVGTAPTTTTTIGVNQVPEEITVEYLQRVMDALDQSWGDFFRQYLADRGPTIDNLAWLAELYGEPEYERIENELGELAALEFVDIKLTPGNPDTVVQEIAHSSPTCIVLSVRRTLDSIYDAPADTDEEAQMHIGLQLVDAAPLARNRTAWKIVFDGQTHDGTPPPGVCP